jgi:hypothetical protein
MLFDIKEAEVNKKSLLTVDDVVSKFGERLKEQSYQVATENLKASIESAKGRWEEGLVLESYKGAKNWTIDGQRKKQSDVDKGDASAVAQELVKCSIKVGKVSMDLDPPNKKFHVRVRGHEVVATLSKFLEGIKDSDKLQGILHAMNKENKHTDGSSVNPKKYYDDHDRYLTEAEAATINEFLERTGLEKA